MKFISILLVTLFINACGGSKNAAVNAVKNETETSMNKESEDLQGKDMVLEYIEQTRGFYKMIRITPEMVSSKLRYDGSVETKACDKTLWNALMNEMETVSLKEIPTLKAPSTTHRYDAKPMANLNITKGGETYSTVTFDAGDPHEKLAGLVNTILTAIDKKD